MVTAPTLRSMRKTCVSFVGPDQDTVTNDRPRGAGTPECFTPDRRDRSGHWLNRLRGRLLLHLLPLTPSAHDKMAARLTVISRNPTKSGGLLGETSLRNAVISLPSGCVATQVSRRSGIMRPALF